MANKKILVIDDNPVIVRMNQSLLKSSGFDVISANDGDEGLKLAREQKPDVILLDVILPEKHGFEVCKELKTLEETKNIPVIIVTASGLEDVAKNEPDLKVEDIIAKPYGLQELSKAVNKVLGISNTEEQG